MYRSSSFERCSHVVSTSGFALTSQAGEQQQGRQPSPTNNSAGTQGNGLRPNKPSNLYIPMDSPSLGVSSSTGSDKDSRSWPFRDGGLDDRRPSLSPYPSSPSMINPSYADLPDAPRILSDYAGVPSPTFNKQDHSSIQFGPAGSAGPLEASSSKVPLVTPKGRRELTSHHGAAEGSVSLEKGLPRGLAMGGSNDPPQSSFMKSIDSPTSWLVMYFAFNLGLTLYNKLVLQGFPFAWTLTAIQMLGGTLGTQIALARGFFTQARLTTREGMIMVAFSVLYTINIAVSNLSLGLVSVPFHQVVRAMTPLFTIVLAAVLYGKRHSRDTYLALIPVVAGVVFATYGDYSATAWGFILTLIGTLLAALKTIVTNRVQVGRLKLHPLDLLIRMSPLAFCQCVFFGWSSGELDRVRIYSATEMTQRKAIALAMNGAIAFGLNVVSFTANKKTSALTMTVAANVKQVLTIVLAVLIFNVQLNPMNLFGISLTLIGGAWYAKVELQEKQSRSAALNSANVQVPLVRPGDVKN
ncbi:hypothetical protein OIO90_006444 [Microbotryomycetes sp. JL221]|nr:hypothetical protein OIO90_006444 [Microbotryomycetes sp. JL221]